MSETDLATPAAIVLASLLAGWLAGLVTRGSGFGLKGNIAVAFAGALVGTYLLSIVGLDARGSFVATLVVGLLSAFLILAMIGEMRR